MGDGQRRRCAHTRADRATFGAPHIRCGVYGNDGAKRANGAAPLCGLGYGACTPADGGQCDDVGRNGTDTEVQHEEPVLQPRHEADRPRRDGEGVSTRIGGHGGPGTHEASGGAHGRGSDGSLPAPEDTARQSGVLCWDTDGVQNRRDVSPHERENSGIRPNRDIYPLGRRHEGHAIPQISAGHVCRAPDAPRKHTLPLPSHDERGSASSAKGRHKRGPDGAAKSADVPTMAGGNAQGEPASEWSLDKKNRNDAGAKSDHREQAAPRTVGPVGQAQRGAAQSGRYGGDSVRSAKMLGTGELTQHL